MTNQVQASTIMFNKYFDMVKLLNTQLNHFPKHEKYGLSLKIRNCAYDLYELMIECKKKYYNKTTFTKLDIRHEQLRMFLKLAFDLGYYEYKRNEMINNNDSLRRFMAISSLVNELGRLIGGWIKHLNGSKCLG